MNRETEKKEPFWPARKSGFLLGANPLGWLSAIGMCALFLAADPAWAQDSTSDDGAENQRCLIVVRGVAGTDKYESIFSDATSQWEEAADLAGFKTALITSPEGDDSCLAQLEMKISEWRNVAELWIVLIGHGTFDGESAKFNLVGDDVAATQIAEWLAERQQKTILINCASSSGPFVNALAGSNRVVVTATKSGYETSFAHFGRFLAQTLSEKNIDLDKDGRTSLLESVIAANGKTKEFYEADSRLPTEHALIDDNGDALGTPVEWYRGIRISREAKEQTQADGLRANQVFLQPPKPTDQLSDEQQKERDKIESELELLINRKSEFSEERYYQQMEAIMLRLANLYRTKPVNETEAEKGQ